MYTIWLCSVSVPRNRVFPGEEVKQFTVKLESNEEVLAGTVRAIALGKGYKTFKVLGAIKIKTVTEAELNSELEIW